MRAIGDIPGIGRIVAIADVFDALTSKRPYKEEWPVEEAAHLLEAEMGEHFDPHLVRLFLKAMPQIREIKERFVEK